MSNEKNPWGPLLNLLKNPSRIFSLLRLLNLWQKTYFGAQKKTDLSKAQIIENALDDRIAIQEEAIYPYLFACIYILYASWVMMEKLSAEEFKLTVDLFEKLILDSERIFLARPTQMKPRDRIQHPLTRMTHTIDGATNCYPSMHISLTVLCYQIIKGKLKADPIAFAAMRKTCVEICRSTMQTKQHSVIDVVGGNAMAKTLYQSAFSDPFEDLLEEIFMELKDSDLKKIRGAMKEAESSEDLLDRLLHLFGKPTKPSKSGTHRA